MTIRTTVVGSYPIPHWFQGRTDRGSLRDAIMVVLKTQELAGIDVVADGELNRFDPSHPETNGMIDYFVSRMDGIRTRFSVTDIERFREDAGMAYRTQPAGHRDRPHRAKARSTCRAITNSPAASPRTRSSSPAPVPTCSPRC